MSTYNHLDFNRARGLRYDSLIRRLNNEAERHEWKMNSKYNPVGKDQVTVEERMGITSPKLSDTAVFYVKWTSFAIIVLSAFYWAFRSVELTLEYYAR